MVIVSRKGGVYARPSVAKISHNFGIFVGRMMYQQISLGLMIPQWQCKQLKTLVQARINTELCSVKFNKSITKQQLREYTLTYTCSNK